MNSNKYFLTGLILFLFIACTSTENDPEDDIVEDPVATTLIFPEDNTLCNEGTVLSETQSKVVFRWNASEHSDSYELVLKNLETATTENFDSENNSKEITLDRGTQYEWQVISKSTESTATASSETFQFFNAAAGIVNHVPFPADAVAPEDGLEITTTTGKVTLSWEASDIDNDIKDYEVFFSTNENQLTSSGVVTATTFEFDVNSETTYFWMIKTSDETNNTSTSEVFSFSVK